MERLKSLSFMRGNILVLTLTRIIQGFPRRMALPYFSLYILALGGNEIEIGFIRAVGTLSYIITLPIAGYLADVSGRVKLIGTAGYFLALTYFLNSFARDWPILAIGIFLQGLVSFHFPALGAIIADSLPPKQRGVGIAAAMAIPGALGIFSPYVGGYLITKYGEATGIRYMFIITAFFIIIASTIRLKFFKETLKEESSIHLRKIPSMMRASYQNIAEVLRWMPRNLIALAFILTLINFFNAIIGPFWIVYGINVIELTVIEWGLIELLASGIRVALMMPAGTVVDRVGKRKIITISLTLTILPMFFFVYSKNFVGVLLVSLIISVSNAFLMPALQSLVADIVPREKRGSVMATLGRGMVFVSGPGSGGGEVGGPGMGFIMIVPVVAASMFGGYVYSINPAYPWFFMAVALITGLLLSVAFVKEPRKMEL